MVTIHDVAEKAGVSRSTVSRVMNGYAHVDAGVRARVEQAIAQLGYVPNASAQSLARQKTDTILVAHNFSINDHMYGTLSQHVIERAETHGLRPLFQANLNTAEKDISMITGLKGMFDGIIIFGAFQRLEERSLTTLRQMGIPFVLFESNFEQSDVAQVNIDNRGGMERIVRHLCQKGHRRIAYVTNSMEQNFEMRARYDGFLQALAAAGLTHERELFFHLEASNMQTGYQILDQVLTAHPTAVCCCNDLVATGVIRRAAALHVDVPGQLSVTGFDNLFAQSVEPEFHENILTTVQQPFKAMAYTMVDLLVSLIQKTGTPQNITFPVPLIERASVAQAGE